MELEVKMKFDSEEEMISFFSKNSESLKSSEETMEEKPSAKKAATKKKAAAKKKAEEPGDTPTYADVTEALQSVLDAKGMPPAKALLANFGASKATDIAEEQYAEFIAECTSVVEGE